MNDKISSTISDASQRKTVAEASPKEIKQNAEAIVEQATKKASAPAPIKKTAAKKPGRPAGSKKTVSAAKKATKTAAKAGSKVVSMNKNAVGSILKDAKEEARRAQEQAMSMSYDGADYINRGVEVTTKIMNESAAIGQENLEACMEASQISADHANVISESLISYANDAISENVDLSKELFACRTASDVFELQNRFIQSNIERFFNETSRLSDMVFEATTKSAEPFNDRMSEAADRLQKAFA